jgi:DNA polymerase III alpha subunit (gram-positive type)
MSRYIALDTETGGVTPDTSLLTAYFAVFNVEFDLVDELDLKFKPEDGVYHVTAEALGINQINLIEHDKTAITYKAAKPILYDFLSRNYRGNKLTPVGHGIYFDLIRVKSTLISTGAWEGYVSYRTLDTSIVCQFLRAAGLFPDDVSGSLGSLVKYLGLPNQGDLHDAKVDTLQTVSILRQLLNIVKPINEVSATP